MYAPPSAGIFGTHTVAKDSSGRGNDLQLSTAPQPHDVQIGVVSAAGGGGSCGRGGNGRPLWGWWLSVSAPAASPPCWSWPPTFLTAPPAPTRIFPFTSPAAPPTAHPCCALPAPAAAPCPPALLAAAPAPASQPGRTERLSTGSLEFRNSMALNKAARAMPDRSFSVELWAKGRAVQVGVGAGGGGAGGSVRKPT